jgi:hypothetical protein
VLRTQTPQLLHDDMRDDLMCAHDDLLLAAVI